MKNIILVLGAWGSGTTAVTGVLDHLGAYTCPPHFNTNDPKTLCSYESVNLRHILHRYINEEKMLVMGSRENLISEIVQWLNYVFNNEAIDKKVITIFYI